MERHPFSDISWQVTEPEYRADHESLSYSNLSKYEREGRFKVIPSLYEEISTPSLVFGSMVDTLITGTEEDFNNLFIVMEDPGISDTLRDITTILYSMNRENRTPFMDIPDEVLAQVGKDQMYYAGDKYEQTRVKKIRESCMPYYNMLMLAEGKSVVTSEDVEDARRCVDALKNGMTANYFKDNEPFGNNDTEGYYQLKFRGTAPDGVKYRCMADRILVNHKLKVVIPIDLKTSSHEEHEFFRSFTQWRYKLNNLLEIFS